MRHWISYAAPPPSIEDDLFSLDPYVTGHYLEMADWYRKDPNCRGHALGEDLFALWMPAEIGHHGIIYHSEDQLIGAVALHVFSAPTRKRVPVTAVAAAQLRLRVWRAEHHTRSAALMQPEAPK